MSAECLRLCKSSTVYARRAQRLARRSAIALIPCPGRAPSRRPLRPRPPLSSPTTAPPWRTRCPPLCHERSSSLRTAAATLVATGSRARRRLARRCAPPCPRSRASPPTPSPLALPCSRRRLRPTAAVTAGILLIQEWFLTGDTNFFPLFFPFMTESSPDTNY